MKIPFNQIILFICLVCFVPLFAQESESEKPLSEEEKAAALAKATQNPLAAMYSLPFQNNTTFDMEPDGGALNILNIQPVLPFKLSDKLNLVTRTIIPVISVPSPVSKTGLGDTNLTAWISPSKASKLIYGIGPAIQIPTSTGREFGSGEWGVGPSLVVLTMIDQWVAGIVTNNVWTFGDTAENKFLFQYFVNYNLPDAWYIVSAPILTANWNASDDDRWVVPFGAGAGKIIKIGKQPINLSAHGYYNAVKPDSYGDWQMRLQVQLLFPKKK